MRAPKVIADEIRHLNDAQRAGHVSDAAFAAALQELSAELTAASGSAPSGPPTPPPSVPAALAPMVRPAAPTCGGVRLVCPACAAQGVYLICLQCRNARSFTILPTGAAECACGSVIESATCTCSTPLSPRCFLPVAAEDVPSLNGEATPGSPGGSFVKQWVFWAVAIASLVACIGVCKGCGENGFVWELASDAMDLDAKIAVTAPYGLTPDDVNFVEIESFGRGRYYVVVETKSSHRSKALCVVMDPDHPHQPLEAQVYECSKADAVAVFGG